MCADLHYDISIQIQIDTPLNVPEKRVRQAVEWVLKKHGVAAQTGISVVLTNDEIVQRMNRQFRAVDSPTDVLSFPADDSPMPSETPYAGDVVLALPYIQRQANTEQHAFADELILAVIHGALHLLGYDHDTAEHQVVMWAAQAEALAALGVPIEVPLFEFPDDEPANPDGE